MTYYNEGTFTTKNQEDMGKLVEILNLEGLDPYGFAPEDAYESDGQFCLELNDCNGDIEQQIDKIAEACQEKHLDVDFEIHYYGDAEGAYLFHNGVYECLGEEEYHAHQMDEKVLLKEIYRRGLNRKICNDAIRSFMQSELENQYDMDEKNAKRAAAMAFEYCINTEGASQYDGIEWAAKYYRSYVWVEVSRETLPEYWDDFAIVIAFPDGTDTLAQDSHYTLHDCLHKLDGVKFFIDGTDVGGQCEK